MEAHWATVNPSHKFLYVGGNDSGGPVGGPWNQHIWQFLIQPNGALKELTAKVTLNSVPLHIAVTSSNRIYVSLLGAYHGRDTIAQFGIQKDGRLKRLARPVISPLRLSVNGLTSDPTGRFLYAVSGSTDSDIRPGTIGAAVALYRITSDGTLRPMHPAVVPLGRHVPLAMCIDAQGRVVPNALQYWPLTSRDRRARHGWRTVFLLPMSPDGRFAFLGIERPNKILSFRIRPGGSLKHTGTTRYGKNDSNQVVVEPSGRFAYGRIGDNQTISRYRVLSNGRLKPLAPLVTPHGVWHGCLVFVRSKITPTHQRKSRMRAA